MRSCAATVVGMTTTSTTPRRDAAAGSDRLLRRALQLDAGVTGLNGAGYLAAAAVLDDVLGMPTAPLRALGAFLLVFAAAVGLLGTRTTIANGAVVGVVAANLLWVLASLTAAVGGWHEPTAAGTAWIVLQAAVVAAFALLQWRGRRAR